MLTRSLTRTLGTAAALASAGAVAIGTAGAEGGAGDAAATKQITAEGVGRVKLGKTFRRLRSAGLVSRLGPGCELGGPNTRSAKLRAPLKGTVDFTTRNPPRRARTILVRAGGEARGVGIGDKLADIKAAFPKAKVDHRSEEVFGITRVKIPRNGGGPLAFSVDVDSGMIDMIGIPDLAFCE